MGGGGRSEKWEKVSRIIGLASYNILTGSEKKLFQGPHKEQTT